MYVHQNFSYVGEKDGLRFESRDGLTIFFPAEKIFYYSSKRPWEDDRSGLHAAASDDGFVYLDEKISAAISVKEEGEYLRLVLDVQNVSGESIEDFACGLAFDVDAAGIKATVPHLLYNDNPSAAPERVVPHVGTVPGKGTIAEEHRLPVPAVNFEWMVESKPVFFTLLSVPDIKTGKDEEYWSLGVLRTENGLSLRAMSGPLMFNGEKDYVYGGQCLSVPSEYGYRSLAAGERLTKTFYLHAGSPEGEGKGFRSIIAMGNDILKPKTEALHDLPAMIAYKKNVMDSRFHEGNRSSGYICYGSANKFGDISKRPEYYLYAWTGQALKLAWCDCALGIKTDEKFRLKRGMDVADFYVKNSVTNINGMRRAYYYHDLHHWGVLTKDGEEETISSRMQGEAFMDLIDMMMLLRENNVAVPADWEKAVRDCCDFLMDERYQTKEGIYPLSWTAEGKIPNDMINAAGMPCVAALVKAYSYFSEKAYLEYAIKKYEIYYDLHMKTFDIPFARATMDARCEDKEAGLYFFVAAAELFKATGDERFANWADISADWILTFVYFWETGFNDHTICYRKGFKTTGWPGVSVQNHHLDVFFPTYEMYEYGKVANRPFYCEMATHVKNALTHGVCTYPGEWGFSVVGEQGEQYYQTNYGQARRLNNSDGHFIRRGGMHVWNPSWITAQVLQSSIRLYYAL